MDIYGRPAKLNGEYAGAQCKNLQTTLGELKTPILGAESFKPPLKQFILSVGAPRDAKLQEQVRMIDIERVRNGKFSVNLISWDDLTLVVSGERKLFEKHFPQFGKEGKQLENVLALRREHSRLLVDKPLDEIRQKLDYPDSLLMVWANGATNEIVRRKIDINDNLSPNARFLMAHLKTGYPDVYEAIGTYENLFNRLVTGELSAYEKVEAKLKEFDSQHKGIHWEVSIARCVEAFSQMIEVEFGRGGKREPASVEGVGVYRVRTGSYIIAHTDDPDTSSKLADRMNSFFEDESILKELKQVARESQEGLLKSRRLIDNMLEEIRALVLSNVPLSGSCLGGQTGEYES